MSEKTIEETIRGLKVNIPSSNDEVSEKAKEVLTPDEKRKENEKTHIHRLSIGLLYVLASCAVVIALVVVSHLVLPEKYRWLTPIEIINLKSIFVSGVGGAILAKFGNKLVDK